MLTNLRSRFPPDSLSGAFRQKLGSRNVNMHKQISLCVEGFYCTVCPRSLAPFNIVTQRLLGHTVCSNKCYSVRKIFLYPHNHKMSTSFDEDFVLEGEGGVPDQESCHVYRKYKRLYIIKNLNLNQLT